MQRTAAWHAARLNKLTASNVGAALGQVKWVSRQTAYKRAIGMDEFEGNCATRHGIATEDEAIAAYERHTRTSVTPTGLHTHPQLPWLAGSPDGLVAHDGMIEVKCPYWQMHKGPHTAVPNGYYLQCQQLLQCTGRCWCDYVCYCASKGMSIFRVTRDDDLWAAIASDVYEWSCAIQWRKGPPKQTPAQKRKLTIRINRSQKEHTQCTAACACTI